MTTKRVIVYTGKGGVGKTTIAAATGLLCARRGLRTLIASTDIAHSLGDAFGRPIGPEATPLDERLWGQEIDVYHTIRAYWGAIQSYFAQVFRWRGLDDVIADEMTVLPGLDEVVSLLRIVDHVDAGEYDVIVVDAAPTGETIRLLALPEAARWWVDRILPIQRRATQIAGPILRRVTGMPMPDDAVFQAGEDLLRKIDRMHQLLSDPSTTSLRIVVNLEKVVIAEARRSFTYFHLFGYPTDLIVCNRILPPDPGPYFARWKEAQDRNLDLVKETFHPVPLRRALLLEEEAVGIPALTRVGEQIFERDDPSMVFYSGRPYRVERDDGGFALSLELPFVAKDEVKVRCAREELIVQVGGWRRNLLLPRLLADRTPEDARLVGGVLQIHFGGARRRSEEESTDA